MHAPTPRLPPDIDPGPHDAGHTFGHSAEPWWDMWSDGILILLITWVIFLGTCAAAVVSWAYTAGLFGS